jgi:hypothetical protein
MAEPEENYSAEAEATSRDPHDWGRAMALAVTRLAEQLAPEGSPDIHASLLGRDLLLRIRDDPAGVTITVSSEAGPDGSGPGADEPAGHAAG